MKTLNLYLLAVCWCAAWFLGCGGSTSVEVSNEQSQNQASDEANIQTAQEACAYCVDSYDKEGTLSECVTSLGYDVSDC